MDYVIYFFRYQMGGGHLFHRTLDYNSSDGSDSSMAGTDVEGIAAQAGQLHIPAILQNPTNRAASKVAAHNAQQREKAAARKEARDLSRITGGTRGKRVTRRKENTAFTSNPHIVQPKKSDFTPPVPLHHHPITPRFPATAIQRLQEAPGSKVPVKDAFSADSKSGTFSTSLKGTRALLRKGGRRAEQVVLVVEGQVRDWLSGRGHLDHDLPGSSWKVIDGELVQRVHDEPFATASSSSSPPPLSRRMPEQHQIRNHLPALPAGRQIPAILELSRSPAHLTWAISDGFDRLVTHLVARYYELVSWSEDHGTADGEAVRLTHLVLPSLALSKAPPASRALATPETSDMSAPSSSDRDSSTEQETDTDIDSISDAETQVGDNVHVPGDTLLAIAKPAAPDELVEHVGYLDLEPLQRTFSNSSSAYASSEGGSDYDMVDSITLPRPVNGPVNGGWMSVAYSDAGSDLGDAETEPRAGGDKLPARTVVPAAHLVRMGAKGWEERPTFFDYLYGDS